MRKEEIVDQWIGEYDDVGRIVNLFALCVLIWAMLTLVSRVLIGRHFVFDVVVGACLRVLEGNGGNESLDQNDQAFKPGWKEIFKMNQSELEADIRKVSRDSSLDPRRKAYLIQNLVTSRWIAAQQKSTLGEASSGEDPGCSPSYRDAGKTIFGCEHYKRNCKLCAACCGKLFTCRFCHDKVSDHCMVRKATLEMMCTCCLKIQPVGPVCVSPSCNGFDVFTICL